MIRISKCFVDMAIIWFLLMKPSIVGSDAYFVISAVLLLYLTPNIIRNLSIRSKTNFSVFLVFQLIAVFSTYRYFGFSNHTIRAVIFSYSLIAAWMNIEYYARKGHLKKVFSSFLKLVSIYIILTYLFMLIAPHETTYFVGSKFKVSYIHMLFITLWLLNHQNDFVDKGSALRIKREIQLIIIVIVSLLVSIVVGCSTGIVALILLYIMVKLPKRIMSKIMQPYVVAGIFLAINFLFIGSDLIINSKWFDVLVNQIFDEAYTLRGRLNIYSQLMEIFSKSPIWGYGYDSTVVHLQVGYGNAQNGLLKLLIDYGLIGTILFFVYLVTVNSKNRRSNLTDSYFWIFVLAMIACSLIEVSINTMFYLVLILIGVNGSFGVCSSEKLKT